MAFLDRKDAGQQLARVLKAYARVADVVVIGIPRGGVELAATVANVLALPLDIVVPRKIGQQDNPEYAIGAIAETGDVVWNAHEYQAEEREYLEKSMALERVEANRRLRLYRRDLPERDLLGKTVIIIDDGVATGYTMHAAILAAHALGAVKVVVAVPHGAPESLEILRHHADEVYALLEPDFYTAVSAYYGNFSQVSDDEVIRFLHTEYVTEDGKKRQDLRR